MNKTGYVTKYALSKGHILRREGECQPSDPTRFRQEGAWVPSMRVGREVFFHEDEAMARADEMRTEKIASLKKQIARLEKLKFVVKDPDQ